MNTIRFHLAGLAIIVIVGLAVLSPIIISLVAFAISFVTFGA